MPELPQATEQQIKWSFWYLTHREQVRRWLALALALINAGLWGYSLVRWGVLFLVEEPRAKAAILALSREKPVIADRSRFIAGEIQTLDEGAFLTNGDRQDFYSRVQNPNGNYAALSFFYYFLHDGGETPRQVGYILPGAEMYLYALGVDGTMAPRNRRLIIENVVWKRVVNWENKKKEMLDLAAEEIAVKPLPSSAVPGVAVSFTFRNNTAYRFWSVDVPIVFSRAGRVTGINAIRLQNIEAGERRPVTVQWFGVGETAANIHIAPQVNALDPAVFQKVRGGEQRF